MNENKIPALESIATRFGEVLQSESERDIHAFLESNVHLLDFLGWGGFVKSKVRLADSYIPDFLVVGEEPFRNSPRPLVTLIEIERANEQLFTKSGDPTAFLTHAIRQAQDWKRWVTDNRSYLKDVLHKLILDNHAATDDGDLHPWRRDHLDRSIAYGFADNYLIIAGRRDSMRIEDRLLLSQMNRDLQGVSIITYDVILDHIFRNLDPSTRRAWDY